MNCGLGKKLEILSKVVEQNAEGFLCQSGSQHLSRVAAGKHGVMKVARI